MRLTDAKPTILSDMWAGVTDAIGRGSNLEDAAQELTKAIYETFSESVVQARIFITVPFGHLPRFNAGFVRELADSAGALESLVADTPVLSLIGTHGQNEDWDSRHKSRKHVGIPLISAGFLHRIPMISRLMKELNLPVNREGKHDSGIFTLSPEPATGLFFVDNAENAMDDEGRRIISDRDFVSEYGVRGVFGVGGAYPDGQILVAVVFCRDDVNRESAEGFLSLITEFIRKTSVLAAPARVFAD